ncbi:UDP-glucose:glycoprotein glucosyltransferase [Skeletonema marinoi]|uniref:UDP-glucose:glycoprotein glucosyltransferase n=1 Tax=Skeletonema marinoi TaxID=267567 RepID=A0AAD8YG14_9STRA|nr:UDP-glucose:glycoprotein glucosyltransferase [Skeletonema marinoi]
MWRFQLGIRLLFIVIYARESFCLSANERSGEEKGSSSAPTLSSFQQYTNAIPSDQPVTPHGRRDVEASVKAYSWPSTIFSPLCEAWAYFESSIGNTKSTESNSNSLSWKYLDALVERGGVDALNNWIDDQSKEEQSPWTFDNSTALAIEIASQITQSNETSHTLDRQLLPMALSLRAHSPHCEMHRSLARDAAIVYGLYDVEKGNLPPSAFCLLSRRDGDNNIIGTQLVIDESLLTKALEELNSLESSGENVEHEDSHLLTQLPGESIHLTTSSDEFVAILYGQVGTSAFASLYKSLRNSQLHLIVRHMGFIPYEENNDASVAFPTVMQGYGVRLDIRNVEYKAFDDGPADDSKGGDAKSDWNEAGHHPEQSARDEYLGGLNLNTILDRLQVDGTKPLATDLHALQTAAIRSHSFQLGSESIIPPAWQRRSLSMQAASLIVSSPDPLEALKGVSQNLPSVAHSLSNIQISEEFEALAEKATDLAAKVGAVSPGWGDAAFGFYVNSQIGKSGDFSMMNPMANESSEEDEIESDFDEEEGSQIYRIDVGRGGKNAVLYLNDIEKDPEYSSWPTSMQQMLYSAQFGGAPTVRRNLFTMLLVIDPADGNPCPALGAVAQLLNAQFPLRLGVLIVNKNDVEKGLLSEPLPWDNGDRPFHASDSFLLLKHITNKYGGMVAISCLFQLLHESAKMDDTISVKEYVSAHVSLFVQMGVLHQGLISNVQDELMNILKTGKDPENANSKNKNLGYESAVQFAKDKLIRPGMSFFNGIPLRVMLQHLNLE